jgi:hypothetical protein
MDLLLFEGSGRERDESVAAVISKSTVCLCLTEVLGTKRSHFRLVPQTFTLAQKQRILNWGKI